LSPCIAIVSVTPDLQHAWLAYDFREVRESCGVEIGGNARKQILMVIGKLAKRDT